MIKKRRGRPPGSKNREGSKKPGPKPGSQRQKKGKGKKAKAKLSVAEEKLLADAAAGSAIDDS